MFDGRVPPTLFAAREAPAARPPSQSRESPLYIPVAVDSSVRECTKAMASRPSLVPEPAEGCKDLASHGATAGAG